MAKAKQTAFVLDEAKTESYPSSEPQTFGTVPGLWVRGIPVLLADLDPGMTEAEFKRSVKDAGAPIVPVKVDADYRPKRGHSQLELRQKGGTPHLPSGRPLMGDQADTEPYRELPVGALEDVAEARGVEDVDDLSKAELVEAVEEQDEGGK